MQMIFNRFERQVMREDKTFLSSCLRLKLAKLKFDRSIIHLLDKITSNETHHCSDQR
jgi:hypothetical protein